jgi:chaperonin GroES
MTDLIKPLNEWILAENVEKQTTTASGLYVTETNEMTKTATVLRVGGNVTTIEKGQTIIYKSYTNTDVKIDGKDYILVLEDDVLAIK